MVNIKPSKVTIGGHSIPETMPFEIKFTRGLAPYRFEFPVDPIMIEGVQSGTADATGNVTAVKMVNNPDIVISAANQGGTGSDAVTIKGWYFLGIRLAKGGHYVGMMADPRFGLNFQKLSGAFNTRGFAGRYKDGTLNSNSVWKVGSFIERAFNLIGRAVSISNKIESSFLDAPLPDNFSNVSSGAVFGASANEWLPQLLESMRADLVVDINGTFRIVDRSSEGELEKLVGTDNKASQVGYAVLDEDTVVGKNDIHWQKPAAVRVIFRKQIERRMKILGSGITQTRGDDIYLRNVSIPYTFDKNGVPELENLDFKDIRQVVIDNVKTFPDIFKADRWLRERVLRPSMLNLQGLDVVEQRKKSAQVEVVRSSFRRWWQLKGVLDSDNALHRRVFSKLGNIRFGRISAKGTANAPAAFGTWVERRAYGILDKTKKHVLEQQFTENHPYPSAAPFDVSWLDQEQGVLELKPNSESIYTTDAYVGILRKPATFETLDNILRGFPIRFANYGEFSDKERMDIYYVAEIIQDYKNIPGRTDGGGALYDITIQLGGSGGIGAVEFRVDELFANYQMTENTTASGQGTGQFPWPGSLLNKAELQAKADEIAARVEQQFTQARSGMIKYGGPKVLRKLSNPEGAIYEIAVKIGDKASFGITTQVTILPEVRKKVRPKEKVSREVNSKPEDERQ